MADIDASNLPAEIKNKALYNFENGKFATNTVGEGKTKNSITTKYCSGKSC